MKKKNKLGALAALLAAVITMIFANPVEVKAGEVTDRLVTEVCFGYNSYEQPEESKVYYLKNSHGDIIGQVDEDGNLLKSYTYNAFGELVAEVAFGPETESTNQFLYAGEQYDETSGLYYLRARCYDAAAGRFTQEDTYLGDGRNLYAYTHNNPVRYVDPSGHASFEYVDFDDEPLDDWQQEAAGGVGGPGQQTLSAGNSIGQTMDQKALYDLAKGAVRAAKAGNYISLEEAKILDSWASEYNVPQHHQAYKGSGIHFSGGNYMDHTHIYGHHVPYMEILR